ncbi:MAG: substrate-binding domain-containing protein [Clostridiales Family XIII bacterium]|jgi:ABC-type sugar transport system substrate-binding protein|nr:substrate-binding domain-containing protein [Clostridiales Family XIII bacterium]
MSRKWKQFLTFALCLAMVLAFTVGCGGGGSEAAPADTGSGSAAAADDTSAAPEKKVIGIYADAPGSYYDLEVEAFTKLAEQDPDVDWEVIYKVGGGSADEQLKAVEDFIAAGYDAMGIIQNNPTTTNECILKAVEANVPYFGLNHYFGDQPNAYLAAGSESFDFAACGLAAGEDAVAAGVKKVIMIEGVLGQGTASDQSYGFLKAYEDAGLSLGTKDDGTPWTAMDIAIEKPGSVGGTPDIEAVFWGAGEWQADNAQKKMQDAISTLGEDGWDGCYVQNDPMCEGVMAAMDSAGLDPANYWIGACNGREESWQWVKDGKINMDVNQSPCLDGLVAYQQMKAYFAGEDYKQFVYCYITPYNADTIADLEPSLIPCSVVDDFIDKYNAGTIVTDIADPKFVEMPGYTES